MEREKEREGGSVRASECTHTERNEVKWDEQIVPLTAATAPHNSSSSSNAGVFSRL